MCRGISLRNRHVAQLDPRLSSLPCLAHSLVASRKPLPGVGLARWACSGGAGSPPPASSASEWQVLKIQISINNMIKQKIILLFPISWLTAVRWKDAVQPWKGFPSEALRTRACHMEPGVRIENLRTHWRGLMAWTTSHWKTRHMRKNLKQKQLINTHMTTVRITPEVIFYLTEDLHGADVRGSPRVVLHYDISSAWMLLYIKLDV